ncbi:hypothetical protein NOVOSPHI9U_290003 [Novosphingobium sp. 9U]|nr:hypothetical protein NOVOSPHI9U_290003 [Novosphingobium sp. 9U]
MSAAKAALLHGEADRCRRLARMVGDPDARQFLDLACDYDERGNQVAHDPYSLLDDRPRTFGRSDW